MNFNPKITKNKKNKIIRFLGLCKSCGLCLEKCPQRAISFSGSQRRNDYQAIDLGIYGAPAIEVDIKKCLGCGICQRICPDCAVKIE